VDIRQKWHQIDQDQDTMKNSIALLELVVSVVLLSVVLASISKLALKMYIFKETNFHQAFNKISLI
jgi:Tfp pilus assembly protein PilV